MEISGIEPEIAMCKINVLPIKPYPLVIIIIDKKDIQKTTWTFTATKPANLKIALSTYSSIWIVRPEWFEHSSKLSWAACFTNYAMAFICGYRTWTYIGWSWANYATITLIHG